VRSPVGSIKKTKILIQNKVIKFKIFEIDTIDSFLKKAILEEKKEDFRNIWRLGNLSIFLRLIEKKDKMF
jgi:hypothetical protein